MSNWIHKKTVADREKFKINGINVWKHEWTTTGQTIIVKDPLYNQSHKMQVYEIETDTKKIRFAAGEFSNCVWGFYQEENM